MSPNKLPGLSCPLFIKLIMFSIVLISTDPGKAEQKKSIPGYDVHYMAYTTAMLTPEIAKNYRIQRSKTLGIVSISMLESDSQKASAGLVRGEVRNSVGQLQKLDFQRVKEEQAIYYLATFRFADEETLRFKVELGPEKATKLHSIEFTQQFFVE